MTIRNKNTREAYIRAARSFFAWCDDAGIGQLVDIEPIHVAAYVESLMASYEASTVKQHLAGLRMLFDWLVTGEVLATNPAHAVRGPKHSALRGKTPVLVPDQARRLIDSIKLTNAVAFRDRALTGLMIFSFARLSAALTSEPKGFLFRATDGRRGELTDRPLNRKRARDMVRRRARRAGIKEKIGNHTFHATGITAYLDAGGALESAQGMAAHSNPKTTKLYDRTTDAVSLDEVERIRI